MDSNAAVRRMLDLEGMSRADLSRAMGRSASYGTVLLSQRSDLRSSTLAEVADACGYDLAVVRRADGQTIGTIDPPPRREREDGEGTGEG